MVAKTCIVDVLPLNLIPPLSFDLFPVVVFFVGNFEAELFRRHPSRLHPTLYDRKIKICYVFCQLDTMSFTFGQNYECPKSLPFLGINASRLW